MRLRIDEILVKKGFASTRSQAKLMLEAGEVLVNQNPITKAGKNFDEGVSITLTNRNNFVGRGAKKLDYALEFFSINPSNMLIADVGASTGGFTDVLLQNGAKKAYCIDVGHQQLAERLLKDPRVTNIEGHNIRYPIILNEEVDLVVADLSYISLRLTISNILALLKPNSQALVLFKPQFEVGPKVVNKEGVIKDPEVAKKALQDFLIWAKTQNINVIGYTKSPITGKNGNIEYFLLLSNNPNNS